MMEAAVAQDVVVLRAIHTFPSSKHENVLHFVLRCGASGCVQATATRAYF